MKKLVLILICGAILTVFIAFNYLLWDREQSNQSIKTLANDNENKDATINVLSAHIRNLEGTGKALSIKIENLQNVNDNLFSENTELKKKDTKIEQSLEQKNGVIFLFKQMVDIKPLETVIKTWVDSIDKGKYETAYSLQSIQNGIGASNLSLEEFTKGYKTTVKSMKLKALELNLDDASGDKKGDIIFDVTLDIKIADNATDAQFDNDLNERFFTVIYDSEKEGWVISNISKTR